VAQPSAATSGNRPSSHFTNRHAHDESFAMTVYVRPDGRSLHAARHAGVYPLKHDGVAVGAKPEAEAIAPAMLGRRCAEGPNFRVPRSDF
jgi:hypothetical protein